MGSEETVQLHPRPGNPLAGIIFCGGGAVFGLMLVAASFFGGEEYASVLLTSGLLLAVIFGGVGTLCFLSPKPGRISLDLNSQGFRERSVRSTRTFSWRDFDDFGIINDSEGGPEVGFRFSDDYRGKPAKNLFGFRRRFDGALNDTYGMSARELADLLNDWRLRHASKIPASKELIDDLL